MKRPANLALRTLSVSALLALGAIVTGSNGAHAAITGPGGTSTTGASTGGTTTTPGPAGAVAQVAGVPGGGQSASFTVTFTSAAPGQGYVLFGSGPGCSGLVMTATSDQGAGSTKHTVVVTGNDLPGTVGNVGIVPGVTYYYEVVTTSSTGTETNDNGGKCYSITIPSMHYRVTLTNVSFAQGFSFPVAATHSSSVHMFQVGQPASAPVAAVAQNGNPVPLFNLLQSTAGVSSVYVDPFPVASSGNAAAPWAAGLPFFNGSTLAASTSAHTLSNSVTFDIYGKPGDVFSLVGMLMCTNDGLTGLDSVVLPSDAAHPITYSLASYDAGVEANTYYTPDIVDPCALMAPYSNGAPALSVSDGNRNSPPTPSQGSSTSTYTTEPDLGVPFATQDPISALSGVIPDNSGKSNAGSYVPAAWGWSGPVGTVTISMVNG